MRYLRICVVGIIVGLGFMGGSVVGAQGGPQITDDDVNNVARKLYCPVCENIPLDTCGTAACAQWREEIRLQLEAGQTPQQVIDDFVARFGDRVVGTPQDPILRALSLVTPIIVSLLALALAGIVFLRWRSGAAPAKPEYSSPPTGEDQYRARLERDLTARR